MSAEKKLERGLWIGVVALALLVGGLFVWKNKPPADALPTVNEPLSSCDLQQGACAATLRSGGGLQLTINPRPIPLVEPLSFALETDVSGLRRVELDFSGVDMNMGYNRVQLKAADSGRYTGEGMLPVCVRNRMTWEVKVLLSTADAVYSVPFRFETFTRN